MAEEPHLSACRAQVDTNGLYVVVVTCVVLYQNSHGVLETLILKRNMNETEGPGLWTIPGGKVDRADWGRPQKTKGGKYVFLKVLERAMRREIKEETGLDITELTLFSDSNLVFVRTNGIPTIVFRFYGWCSDKRAVDTRNGESSDHAWIVEKQIDEYAFIQNVGEDVRTIMKALSKK